MDGHVDSVPGRSDGDLTDGQSALSGQVDDVEEVMAALAGDNDRCAACEEVPDEHGGCCAECLGRWVMGDELACPFCRSAVTGRCAHLVLGERPGGGWVSVPVADPERLPRRRPTGGMPAPSDAAVRDALGVLAPVLDAYEALDAPPDPVRLYRALAGLLSVPVALNEDEWMVAIYTQHERDAARAEIKRLIRRLDDAFAHQDRRDASGGG